ncbi:MAG: hypothetical protein ABMA64_29760 [Myxococcota bacterium]
MPPTTDDLNLDVGWGGDDDARSRWHQWREALRPLFTVLAVVLLVGSFAGVLLTLGMAAAAASRAHHVPVPPPVEEQGPP